MINSIEKLSIIHKSLLKDFLYSYNDDNNLIVIDLVTVMGTIYCADVLIKKNDNPRNIQLNIPVFNVDLWSNITSIIEELTRWVSGDTFILNFVKIDEKYTEEITGLVDSTHLNSNNYVTLFSGGLDSLAGAYRNYVMGIKSDYVGFINKSEEGVKQREVAKFYREVFGNRTEILLIDKPINKKENHTQSTRSLLYLALAIAKAHFNSTNKVYLYENGVLSLNPEIKNRYTTKTTHPKTIYLYQSILNQLGINIEIMHPFLYSTKGEIINEMDDNFKGIIKHTFTCGMGRSAQKNHKGQCGVCIPCILRKISLSAYDNEKYDVQYHYPYNTKVSQIEDETYRKEYEANLHYFKTYCNMIRSNDIYLEINTRDKYYNGEANFRNKIRLMLNKFVEEFERFVKKHAPY
jgi:7-cyano-7-deazaguanine synthase in queuosine biosynthesis